MRALAQTFRGALAEAWANRSAFWTQVTIMVVNDLAWVVFWVLFFHRVGTVRHWDVPSVLLLQAVLTTAGGLVLGVFANTRSIGRLVAHGELDAILVLPVPTLPYLLLRRVNATNIGDVVFGVALFALAGHPTFHRVAIYLVGTVVSVVLLTGFLVVIGSLALFVARDDIGELGFHAMLLLSAYPADVLGGAARLMVFTVIPAAFVAAVPARLMTSFDPGLALGAVAAAVTFGVAGWVTFALGLRRYTSGAVWTNA